MSRLKMLQTLRAYFDEKGKVLTMSEYKEQSDAPYRFIVVKRKFGNWARLEAQIERIRGTHLDAVQEPEIMVEEEAEEVVTETPVVEETPEPEPAKTVAPKQTKKPVAQKTTNS